MLVLAREMDDDVKQKWCLDNHSRISGYFGNKDKLRIIDAQLKKLEEDQPYCSVYNNLSRTTNHNHSHSQLLLAMIFYKMFAIAQKLKKGRGERSRI